MKKFGIGGTQIFNVAYIDPPWDYGVQSTGTNHAQDHYSLMDTARLQALDIKSLLSTPGAAFVWATSPKLHEAIKCIEAWGLHYRGVAYVWVKTRRDGGIINGQGVRPTYTKPTTEYLLLATTNKTGRPFKLYKEGQKQVVLHDRGAHSEKPEEIRQLILEQTGGQLQYVELFARKKVEGWTCVGNEITGNSIEEDIALLTGKRYN